MMLLVSDGLRGVLGYCLGSVVLTIELEQRLAQMPFMIPSLHILISTYRRPLMRYLNK